MPADVVVPTLGLGRSSGHIAEWYLADGAYVRRGELVYRYESEFVAFDVEAESDGVLRHRLDAGARPLQGSVVAVIYAPGEAEHERNEPGWRRTVHEVETDEHAGLAGESPEDAIPSRVLSWPGERERGPVTQPAPADETPADEQEGSTEQRLRAFTFRPRRDARREDAPATRPAGRLGWITSGQDDGTDEAAEGGRWPGEPPRSEGARGAFSWPQLDRRDGDHELHPRPTALEPAEPSVEEHEPPMARAWYEPEPATAEQEPPPARAWHVPAEWEQEEPAPPPVAPAAQAEYWPAAAPETAYPAWAAAEESVDGGHAGVPDEGPAAVPVLADELEAEEEDAWWEQSDAAEPPALRAEGSGPEAEPLEAADGAEELESWAAAPGSEAPLGIWPGEAAPPEDLEDEGVAPALEHEALGMPPASFRVEVDLRETERLREALADASGEGANGVEIEDFILRSIAMTIAERWGTEGDETIAVVRPAPEADDIRMLHGAARLAIAEIAGARRGPDPAADGDACACAVFLLGDCGLDEGFALPAGHAFAFSVGRVREVLAFEGRSIVAAPTATLTVGYRPSALPLGDAAAMLGNIRRLLEQPDALACEWRPLH